MPSWKKPSTASHNTSRPSAMKGNDKGSMSAADSTPPMNTAGTRSTATPRRFMFTILMAEASGTPKAISMPRT